MKKLLFTISALFCAMTANAYNVGDFYNKNGVKGIVIKVDVSGEHGLIMSLDRFNGKWCSDKKAKFETNAFFEDDGQKNMEAIEKYLNSFRGQDGLAFRVGNKISRKMLQKKMVERRFTAKKMCSDTKLFRM